MVFLLFTPVAEYLNAGRQSEHLGPAAIIALSDSLLRP